MTISYPLTLPTDPGVTRVRLFREAAVAISESPYTFTSQVQVHAGQRWGAEITLPIMTRAQAEPWQIFFLQLNGIQGTFYLGDPFASTPRGTWQGVPAVYGGGQLGATLIIRGLVVGATVEPGDFFQINSRLYKCMSGTTQTADSNGQVTLDIWPSLRESPINGQAIVTQSTKGTFRLAGNIDDLYNSNAMEYYEVSFSAIEAV